MSASEVPVLLGHICSSWRAISLCTPRLWARLHVVEPPRGDSALTRVLSDAEHLEVIKIWLGRSGQCPLSISFCMEHYGSSPSTSGPFHDGQYLKVLVGHARRWRHISLTIPGPMLNEIAWHLTAEDVPILESVTFEVILPRYPPPPVTWDHCEMLRSPRISSFSISGNSFLPDKLPLHWDQLTDLAIIGQTWNTLMNSEMVLQTMSMCPRLRSCKVAINDVQTLFLHPTVELLFLRTLEINGRTISRIPHLLERLSLPELRTLTLHGEAHFQTPFSLTPSFTFWTRLESLNIDSNTFSKSNLLDSLRNLPSSLRGLSICDIPSRGPQSGSLDDDALAVLALCCPALESLVIKHCWTISDSALLHFISAKMTGEYRATLKRVHVSFYRPMTLDILPSVQSFIESGLDISLTRVPLRPSALYSPWKGLADAPDQSSSR
ncbi:hypothetical protein B0H19DRAFT_1100548 [Mycena capillaripes]|nr:hypothetical protein B0H19DRAFT_1100548 [Mycena capillaripes]